MKINSLFSDLAEEIIGVFTLGFMVIIFIFVLVTFGEATGQNQIVNQTVKAILLIIFGIGIPIGIISIIKWIGGLSNERYY